MRTKQEISARIMQLLQMSPKYESGEGWISALQWAMQEPGPPYGCGQTFERYLAEENSKNGN